jgi:hypothetical protein
MESLARLLELHPELKKQQEDDDKVTNNDKNTTVQLVFDWKLLG